MRKAIKLFVLTLLIISITLAVLVIDGSPSVVVRAPEQVNNADTIHPLIVELKESLQKRYEAQQLNVNDLQANSLAGFIHRALPQASVQLTFTEDILTIAATYKLNAVISPVYFNVEIVLKEGIGVNVDSVSIGDLRLPGNFALGIAEYLANTYTSSKVASTAIGSVNSLAINTKGVQIELAPLDSLLRELKTIETGTNRQDTHLLKIRIAHYLRLLDAMYIPPSPNTASGPSLSYYLQGLMVEASILSQQGSATVENEAAILALAIFAGSKRFTVLIGDLSFAIDRIPQASPKPVLQNRQDLSLHFIFSAAIKLLSQKGVSIAIGEFKELMDRSSGGSGYSFVDLAADLSGAHFAELALDPERAQDIQQLIGNSADENLFMVSTEGFDERLSKAEFTSKYGMVDSPLYKQVVARINSRIRALPVTE